MPPIDPEVMLIHRPYLGTILCLGHSHDAGIRNVHWQIRVFFQELQKALRVASQVKTNDQITASHHLQPCHYVIEHKGQLDQDRLAGVKRGITFKLRFAPGVVLVGCVQGSDQQSSISNSLHGGLKAAGGRFYGLWRYQRLLGRCCKRRADRRRQRCAWPASALYANRPLSGDARIWSDSPQPLRPDDRFWQAFQG